MGWPKALLPWPATGRPLVLHVTDTLREAGVAPLAVVTGVHHDRIAPVLAAGDVTVLPNPRHEEGQLSSLLHGLRWAFARAGADWALVTLVDVPAVRTSTVRTLIAATGHADALAVRPCIEGRHGHPVIWHRDVLPLLESADPAQGARVVMRALAADGAVHDVDVEDPGVLRDIDTPDDYERLGRES